MKKIIAALAGLSLFAAAATAEGVTIGAWNTGMWNILANNDDDDIVTGLMQRWGAWGSPTVRAVFSAETDNEGFNAGYAFNIHCNGGSIETGDNAHVWVGYGDYFRIYMGKNDTGVLRSDIAFGLWNWDRIGAMGVVDEEGWTFPELIDRSGMAFVVTPIDGLTIGASIALDMATCKASDIGIAWGGDKGATTGTNGNSDVGGKYVVGYSIEGVGTIKAGLDTTRRHVRGPGYTAGTYSIDVSTGTVVVKQGDPTYAGKIDGDVMEIDAAFDITAVENLFASVGAKIPTDGKEIYVNAGANYQLEGLGIHALVGTKINAVDYESGLDGDDFFKDAGKFGFRIGAGLDYTLENGIGFFGDVQFANDVWMGYNSTALDWNDSNVTFGVGVTKSFTGGEVGIAFEGSTTGNRYKSEDFGFEVPLKVQFSF